MLSQGFVLSRAENSENCYKGNDDQAGRAGPNPPAVTRAVHPLVVTLICKEKKGKSALAPTDRVNIMNPKYFTTLK